MKYCTQCGCLFEADRQICPKDGVGLRAVDDLQPGMIVRGKYRILEIIGGGGMATVYRARHEMLIEERAIKIVLARFAGDKDFLKRFRREASVGRKIQHPHAVRIDDLDQMEDGRPFLVMELLHGTDLARQLRSSSPNEAAQPLAVDRALDIGAQVASALAAAHALGIVHRDIKPDNIFLVQAPGSRDYVKVLDFGIANAKSPEGGFTSITQTGFIVGTPQYMSPEQAMGKPGEQIDGRSDLYSLGVVLFQAITGRLPFQADTPVSMLIEQMRTPAPSPRQLVPALDIPEPVSRILLKALEKQPENRFQTAEEMDAALRNPAAWWTAHAPALDLSPDPVPPQTPVPLPTTVLLPSAAAPQLAPAAQPPHPEPAPALPLPEQTPASNEAAASMRAAPARGPASARHNGTARRLNKVLLIMAPAAAVVALMAFMVYLSLPAPRQEPLAPPPASTLEAGPPHPQPPAKETRFNLLMKAGRTDEHRAHFSRALRNYKQALMLDPNSALAAAAVTRVQADKARFNKYMIQGMTENDRGDLADALAQFKRAHALEPGNTKAANWVRKVEAAMAALSGK